MTVAVADIKATVRQISRRDNPTDFTDAELTALMQEAVRELSKRTLCLKSDTTGTLSGDGSSVTAPSDMVDSQQAIDEFYLDSTLLDPINFDEWRADKNRGYAYRDGTIYIAPTSDNDRTYTLYYRKYHGTLSTNIEFKDEMKRAVVWMTLKKVYEEYELFEKVPYAETQVEREIALNAPVEPVFTRMRVHTRE